MTDPTFPHPDPNHDHDNNQQDDQETGGQLVPFPVRQSGPDSPGPDGSGDPGEERPRDRSDATPAQGTAEGAESAPEVLEGVVVEDGRWLPVNPPAAVRGDWLAELSTRREQRRPVVPTWMRTANQVRQAVAWSLEHAGHVVAFHALRSPLYGLKLALRSPIGFGRVVGRFFAWWFDSRGDVVRLSTTGPNPDPQTYLQLEKHRDARVRGRTLIVAFAALVLAAVTITAVVGVRAAEVSVPSWSWWLAGTVLALALGGAGGRRDRPLIGPAVVPTAVQRLTAEIVIQALGALSIAGINQALNKGGTGITFPAPITRDGPGWRAEVDLPLGVTFTDVMERRDRLASGLRRPLGCVWPEPVNDVHTGRLVLWVGDQDMSKAPPADWPLAKTGQVDLFEPFPFGTDPRRRPIPVRLFETNVLKGGLPGSGKTAATRVLALACALDPTCELWVFELKSSGDLESLEQVSHRYVCGIDDAALEQALQALRDLKVELLARTERLRKLPRDLVPDKKTTRQVANRRHLGLYPLVAIFDEVQNLFTHARYGAEAADLAEFIIKLGRAFFVTLVFSTQRPDKDSIPTGVSGNVGLRFCLRVMGQVENDMILGTSAYKNGIRATTFRPSDRGVGYLVGAADDPQIARSYYIDGPAAERIAKRARALRAKAGTLSGHAIGEDTQTAASYDLLTDIIGAIPAGEAKVWSETVCARLRQARPEIYTDWSPEQLSAALKPYGVKTGQVWGTIPEGQKDAGKGANRRGIVRTDIEKAITERDARRGGGNA